MKKGYIYVANTEKFKSEALKSSKSLKRFTSYPICICLTKDLIDEEINDKFDDIIINSELKKHTYLSKVLGMMNTPYDKTIFLDCDTFICSDIDDLFNLLDYFDFSTTIARQKHTAKLNNVILKNILPEFNTGVIVFDNNNKMKSIFEDWLRISLDSKIKMDMPFFREAVIKSQHKVRFSIIPDEYNLHGFSTMLIIRDEVKVIHERIGRISNTITPFYPSFKQMEQFEKKINKKRHKRLYIPVIGIISYIYSPDNITKKIKKLLGIKRKSKHKFFKT